MNKNSNQGVGPALIRCAVGQKVIPFCRRENSAEERVDEDRLITVLSINSWSEFPVGDSAESPFLSSSLGVATAVRPTIFPTDFCLDLHLRQSLLLPALWVHLFSFLCKSVQVDPHGRG